MKFKERGITGKSFDKAVLDDFQDQVVAAFGTAVKKVAPTYSIDVGH